MHHGWWCQIRIYQLRSRFAQRNNTFLYAIFKRYLIYRILKATDIFLICKSVNIILQHIYISCNVTVFQGQLKHWSRNKIICASAIIWRHQILEHVVKYSINVRENRKGNQELTIQRNWQHFTQKTKKSKTKNTTQYVLDSTIYKQTQIRRGWRYQRGNQ
jgi:hypothetical protein